ncbi:ABC transporter ATP-binding protein [Halalkalibacter nanhaiisediminis]|uniref:NitT/TauT family transport system ATP-binding protein n=1 Tax=Halalkalibacter nanhaiisediminis TaxID=688079 RepID=A0A562QJH6_9BACI|nr:ABC transporter ATP-binding protein [Halalkalibacter nanhaiisediminis]TWI56889.1 NitT/TauT family transport system ATP-binding protein [Halalkalibacter nanhaiisediminis]
MSILQLHKISMGYVTKKEATLALDSISLTVQDGEFVSVLGPSGCGKTTLLSIIAGLLSPTSGRITLGDQELNEKQARANIGYMLQQDYLFPWRTIEDNLTLGQKIRGHYSTESRRMAIDWLEKIGLGDKKDLFPNQLSGGMRQRVALVRMLATNPTLMLLDEPFSALDYQTKLKLEDLVFHTLKSEQKTAVLVTHDIGEAIAMSDRVILLSPRPGRIHRIFNIPSEIAISSPFQARAHPQFNEQFQQIWKEMENFEATT